MSDEDIQSLLFGIVKRARADLEKRFAASKPAITFFQYAVLKKAAESDLSLQDLAKKLGVKPPSVVPVLDVLEERGYLDRKPDKKDGRRISLVATMKGKALIRALPPLAGEGIARAFRKLDPKKKTQLLALLQELKENF